MIRRITVIVGRTVIVVAANQVEFGAKWSERRAAEEPDRQREGEREREEEREIGKNCRKIS